jgi:hypothetical protein
MHPISFTSKKLTKCQQSYCATEKEALALLTAVRTYRIYLCGRVVVYTDHSPLTFLRRIAGVNQKLLRWSLEIDQYDLDIQHIKGRENLLAALQHPLRMGGGDVGDLLRSAASKPASVSASHRRASRPPPHLTNSRILTFDW